MNGPTGRKRILAMILSVAMAASMTSIPALAQEGTQDSSNGALRAPTGGPTTFDIGEGEDGAGDISFERCTDNDHDSGTMITVSRGGTKLGCYPQATQFTITQTGPDTWSYRNKVIRIRDLNGTPVKLTLSNVSLQTSRFGANYANYERSPIEISPGNKLELTVSGENSLSGPLFPVGSASSNGNGAGIYVPAGAELTINASNNTTDTLRVNGGPGGTAIGGLAASNHNPACGKVTILGGKLTLEADQQGATVLGGAGGAAGGDVTIGGNANVVLQGNNINVAIGSSGSNWENLRTLGTLVIEGNAKVSAVKGFNGKGGSVTIRGNAYVSVTGSGNNAAIGGLAGTSLDEITIAENAIVVAQGSYGLGGNAAGGGAAIGGGGPRNSGSGTVSGDGGVINISGGAVTATGRLSDKDGKKWASTPIGGGYGGDGGTINISGGYIETDLLWGDCDNPETFGSIPAQIGGGGGAAGNITISGGTVDVRVWRDKVYVVQKAQNEYWIKPNVALIGKSEDGADTGSVTITGGNVYGGIARFYGLHDSNGTPIAESKYLYPLINPAPVGTVYTPILLDGEAYKQALITDLDGIDYGTGENCILDDSTDETYLHTWLPADVNNADVTAKGKVYVSGSFGTNVPDPMVFGDSFAVSGKVTAGQEAKLTATKLPINPTLVSLGDVAYTGAALTEANFTLDVDGSTGAVSYYTKDRGDSDEHYALYLPSDAGNYTVKAHIADTLSTMAGDAVADIAISKATIAPLPGTLEVASNVEHTYVYDLTSLLPALTGDMRYGKVNYIITTASNPNEMLSYERNENILTVKVKNVPNGTATLNVKLVTTNYTDMETTLTVSTVNKKVPVGKPTVTGQATLGYEIQSLTLTGTMTEEDGTTPVPGVFTWANPTEKIRSNGQLFGWVFTPTDASTYVTVQGSVAVYTGDKPVPTGSPSYTPITTSGKTLADANLTVGTIQPSKGVIEWVNSSDNVLPLTTPVNQNALFRWRFTAEDTSYDPLYGYITLWSTGGGGGGGGGSGGGGGGGTPATNPDAPSSNVGTNGAVNSATVATQATNATQALLKAAPGKPAHASVKVANAASISPAALKQIADAAAKAKGTVTVMADTTQNGAVVSRLYIDPAKAANLKSDVKLTVSTSGAGVTAVKNHFNKYFSNPVSVISCAQQGSFGMQVGMAVRVNLTGLDVKNLRLYSYDRATNKFFPISMQGVYVDANGYLRFNTTQGGDIIVSSGPLKTK